MTNPIALVLPAVRILRLRRRRRDDRRHDRHQHCGDHANAAVWLWYHSISCSPCGGLPLSSPHLTQHHTAPCCCLCPELCSSPRCVVSPLCCHQEHADACVLHHSSVRLTL